MPDQNMMPVQPASHKHSHLYLSLAIVGIVAIAGGVLIAIKNFNTEQDVNSTQIPSECTTKGGSALACSAARMHKTAPSTNTTIKK